VISVQVLHGDCRNELELLPDNSIDSIVTDPPYELGFMGKSWDASGIAYDQRVWVQCLRVLKPGGHMLAFSGSRTYHRMVCAIEDVGFQIRDQIMWVYGSGFPKSLNISKAIDKAAGAERENGKLKWKGGTQLGVINDDSWKPKDVYESQPSTDDAKEWDGWGTALKPAHEPIVLARKPLDGTVANNVLTHGTGGINIDGCRVDYQSEGDKRVAHSNALGMERLSQEYGSTLSTFEGGWKKHHPELPQGRFPANFIHDGSEEVLELFPDSKGGAYTAKRGQAVNTAFASGQETEGGFRKMGDDGSAARFFYCAKANKKDRNEGLNEFTEKREADRIISDGVGGDNPRNRSNTPKLNHHPTVKPTELMRYLCRLVTPPNGTVLDPFTGSGSTGKAAVLEGFSFIGIEQSAEYVQIAKARIGAPNGAI
jgi:site-specific DNA-methyltransferase (adenine-specific)